METVSTSSECNAEKEPEDRPYRQGKKYETMHADGAKKAYRCDRSLIPEGCKITKVEFRQRVHEEISRCPCLSASKSMGCENWTLTFQTF